LRDDETISNSLIYIKTRLLRPDFIGTRNDAPLSFSTRPWTSTLTYENYFMGQPLASTLTPGGVLGHLSKPS